MSDLTANIETVYQRIQAAAQRAGRDANEITLVAVSKTHSVETVIEAYQAGLRHFGENRVPEGPDKVTAMADWLAATPGQEAPVWHMIGHVQTRQAGNILENFSLIHSVDSLKLAQRLNRLAERDNIPPLDILLECNVSGEAAKYGFELHNWVTNQERFNGFVKTIEQINLLNKVKIKGLMTMAPLVQNPEKARPVFAGLAALKKHLQTELPHINWQHLSMGMTDDFEVAIEEGATIVRVGRAIFGPRLYC